MIHIPDAPNVATLEEYMNHYGSTDFDVEVSCDFVADFDRNVVLNDYEAFRNKLYHTVMAM